MVVDVNLERFLIFVRMYAKYRINYRFDRSVDFTKFIRMGPLAEILKHFYLVELLFCTLQIPHFPVEWELA